jgi:trehalose utilization protein
MMPPHPTRRAFLQASAIATSGVLAVKMATANEPKPTKSVRVVVWDEQQRQQKEAYENYLGNWIADYLKSQPGLAVKSVRLDDPEQGLSADTLAACDVLVWWGHQRQAEVKPKTGRKLVERIKDGTLSLIALHSAHWSTPFVEAMNEVTRLKAEGDFAKDGKGKFEINYVAPAPRFAAPKVDARLTPCATQRKFFDGHVRVTVHLPICCFPAYRADGKPSQLRVLKPEHPIVKGLPKEFELPHTEMYDEPFHVPNPDEVILEERWETGEWFRSGMVWQVGKGRVFYFRPGHETFAVYKEKPVLRILSNAVRWLGGA